MSDIDDGLSWIRLGERFAMIGLDVDYDQHLQPVDFNNGLKILRTLDVRLPAHWREWLGSIQTDEMSRCGLFIVANIQSEITGTGDPEESTLKQRAYNMLSALTLSCKFTSNRDPWLVTGSFGSKGLEVHSHEELLPSRGSIVVNPKAIGTDQVVFAGRIAKALGSLDGPWDDGNWRFLRCLSVYDAGRRDADALERIHQFVRCVEGLICAKAGDGTKKFKSRTELFVGPRHHDLMGELYDTRSQIEHLHEHRLLASRDRATRVRLAELEAISEWIARSVLVHILLNPSLLNHFGSFDKVNDFWDKQPDDRRLIWGMPIDPRQPLKSFDFSKVHDGRLGAKSPP